MLDTESVSHYYNANTRLFLRYGGSGDTAAIHRAVWAPGIGSKRDALLYVNRFIADQIKPLIPGPAECFHFVDLGCGVGGTSLHLARTLGIRVTGITLSEVQTRLATSSARRQALDERARFITADFMTLPGLEVADAMCAVESFAHVREPGAFFAMCAQQLHPGGRLILCDDFLAQSRSEEAEPWLDRVREGWHLHNLNSVSDAVNHASAHGFRVLQDFDLSPWLRSFPAPALWLLCAVTRLRLPGAYWQNLRGGSALQTCIRRGWSEYHALVLERT